MFRVGLILNENEASHSKYADTEAMLKSAIDKCNGNGAVGNSYHFVVYDKFNIGTLFDGSNADISALDGLVVATNALSFGEKIHYVLCANKARIETFLDDGKGVFVSSQKKLSNGSLTSSNTPRSVGFLPASLDYYVFDRPEASSSDGSIQTASGLPLLHYPNAITDQLVNDRCINNQFMAHRYRSMIIPAQVHSFVTVLHDNASAPITQLALRYSNGPRNLLICSASNKRLIASTMALDWANHAELLCNILTYITENEPRIFFVRKNSAKMLSPIINSYMIRANVAKIPYRVIPESEIRECAIVAGDAFVFPPYWTAEEVRAIYSEMLRSHREYLTIYHVCSTDVENDTNHKLTKHTNYSSIDLMKDAVIRNLLLGYHSTGWGRSVWTYSYVVSLFERCNTSAPEVMQRVYEELSGHFTKVDGVSGDRTLSGNYDGVVNATCKLLEVLTGLARRFPNIVSPNDLSSVIAAGDRWLAERIGCSAVFDQDICYCLLYLTRYEKYDRLEEVAKARLLNLFEQLLARISEELLSGRIITRSSVELCRISQTLYALSANKLIEIDRIAIYLDRIENTLRDRQDIYGVWRNISETAEVTLMLLESYGAARKMGRDGQVVNVLISKGIEALHSQYDLETNAWANDIGTTARAMDAITLYDVTFNFAINDFFSDIRLHRDAKVRTPHGLAMERVRYFYEQIDILERDRATVTERLNLNEMDAKAIQKKLLRAQIAAGSAIAAVVVVSCVLVFLVFALYVTEKAALNKVLGDWVTDWRAGLVGLIITLTVTLLINALKKIMWTSKK